MATIAKIHPKNEPLFAKQLARARKAGLAFGAKAFGCGSIRFGKSAEEAAKKAEADARRIGRSAGGYPPAVEVFEI